MFIGNPPLIQVTSEQNEAYSFGGLLGDVRDFLYKSAPRQSLVLAEAGAIGYLVGLCGNAYNVSGAGLNQYIACLADTGVGKDANSEGFSKLTRAIWTSPEPFPHSGAEFVSAAGLIKWLARFPCHTAIIGEFAKKLAKWNDPRNANDYAISRVVLQAYSKSGRNGSFDPMAYSDPDKVTKRLSRPSLSILAEGTTDGFLAIVNDEQIGDGSLPRFLVFEHKGNRAYLNEGHDKVSPGDKLTANLQSFMAQCNAIRARGDVYDIPFSDLAKAEFARFDQWTTDTINVATSGISKQLWNRADLKARKLAGLAAISLNWTKPEIRLAHVTWATNLVAEQTYNLIAKFANGETGAIDGNQLLQLEAVQQVICDYLCDSDLCVKYGPNRQDIWQQHIITHSHIQRRLYPRALFKNDRLGAEYAVNRAVKSLLSDDVIREIPPVQMFERFGCKPKAYVASNAAALIEANTKKRRI